jgi:hypothetical protein
MRTPLGVTELEQTWKVLLIVIENRLRKEFDPREKKAGQIRNVTFGVVTEVATVSTIFWDVSP